MGYEVLVDGLTVHRTLSESKAADGSTVYDHGDGRVYPKGTVLDDAQVATVVKKLYDDGDEHVRSMLKKVSSNPTEGGAEMEEHYMGPDTGSPGVIKPDVAATLAEAQAKTGEGEKELAEGLSDEAAKKVESGEVDLTTATGKAAPSTTVERRSPAYENPEERDARVEAEQRASEETAPAEEHADTKSVSRKSAAKRKS